MPAIRATRCWFGTLERDRLELVAEVSEPIATVLVSEGDRVEKGRELPEGLPLEARLELDAAAR